MRHSADAIGVTTLFDAPAFEGSLVDERPSRRSRALALAEPVALCVAFVVWARFVTAGTGGRDEGRVLIGVLSLLPALFLVGPLWHRRREALLAAWLGAGALALCALSAFAFAGGQHAAAVLYAVLVFGVARAALTTSARRTVLVVLLALASLDQFAQAFLAWWGGGDPSHPMIGTFYWHNQFGAFLLPGVAAGSALAVFGQRPWRLVGWITAPLCVAGIVFSTSRASMGAAAAILLVVVVAAAVGPARRTRGPAAVALVALSLAATFGFSSSALFPASNNPLAGTAARSAGGQDLGTNTGHRIDFMRAGVAAVADRPVLGAGFGSYFEVSGPHLPPGSTRSTSAHNELVQAWAEGGALFGLPVTALFLLLLAGSARAAWRGVIGADATVRVQQLTAGLGAGALMVHALVDFDWAYPSLLVSVALAAALLCSLQAPLAPPVVRRRARQGAVAGSLVLLTLAAGCAHAADTANSALGASSDVARRQGPAAAAASLVSARKPYAPDPRLEARLLSLSVRNGYDDLLVPAAVVRRALARTARYGMVDADVQSARIGAMFALGERGQALAAARELARSVGHRRPALVQPYAQLLIRTGRAQDGGTLLAATVIEQSSPAAAALAPQLTSLLEALNRAGPELARPTRCAMAAYDTAFGRDERPAALSDIVAPTAHDHCKALDSSREVLR